jgi:hypothetical protein
MAEADFEEDLFADLYNDDDNTAKPSAPAPPAKSEPIVAPQAPEQAPAEEQNGQQDQQYYEDGDDDIDINLGNGNGNDGNNGYGTPAAQDHEAHGPGIKEDG